MSDYRVPTSRWKRSLRTVIITGWAVAYTYLIAAAMARLSARIPIQDLPPLGVTVGLLVMFTLVGAVFVVLGLIDPSIMEISERELVAVCPLKTWRIRWEHVSKVGTVWLLPMAARGQDGYGVRYPVFVAVKAAGRPPILILLSLCVAGKDSGLGSELGRRTLRHGSADHQ